MALWLAASWLTPSLQSSHPSSLLWQRTLSLPAPRQWSDITQDVQQALPRVSAALCYVSSGEGFSLALANDEHLALAPPAAVAPNRWPSACLVLLEGKLLVPSSARLCLINEGTTPTSEQPASSELAPLSELIEIEVRLETSEGMLRAPPLRPDPAIALAQAALRGSLLLCGLSQDEMNTLEQTNEGTAARKVYERFLSSATCDAAPGAASRAGSGGAALRPETLMPAAHRTAHHISHLVREEKAQQAAYLRNTDCAKTAAQRQTNPRHPVYVVLDNLRSAYNVGSIFRSADAAHCAEVVTCGFTPHPPHPKLSKTGFGAVESVPTRHFDSTLVAIATLRAQGIKVYCMETTEHAVSYADLDFPDQGIAIVLGNEEIGVDTSAMKEADGVIEIPCFGSKNSLNVCSAASIVIFEALRQWGSLSRV